MTEANTRYLRRSWNRTKSHLPKHSSLPELHLLPKGRPLFHCGRCGFTNTLIPLCLWCTWTSQEAEHEFERSTPRARRATAPSRAILHVEFSTSVSSCAVPHDRSKKASHKTSVACNKRNQSISKPISLHSPVNAAIPTVSSVIPCRLGLTGGHNTVSDFREMSHDGHNLHGDDSRDATRIYIATQRRSLMNIGADFSVARDGVDDVATATHKPRDLSPARSAQAHTAKEAEGGQEPHSRRDTDAASSHIQSLDPISNLLLSFPSEKQAISTQSTSLIPQSVDRSDSGSMPPTRSTRLKASRRLLIIGFSDHKSSPSNFNDGNTYEQTKVPILDHDHDDSTLPMPPPSTKPGLSPKQNESRTLRRKNHLNIMHPSLSDSVINPASEPIAISLTLHRPTSLTSSTPSHHQRGQKVSQPATKTSSARPSLAQTYAHTRDHSEPESTTVANNISPPLTPSRRTRAPSVAAATADPSTPASSRPSSPSSPFRLGSPDRPYYTAIRKGGVSPTSSRPSSIIGPPLPGKTSSGRPQSYNPPSSFHFGFGSIDTGGGNGSTTTSASRHLSMSAMLGSPPPMSAYSAFSAMDDDDDDDDEDDSPISQAPNPARLSLTSSIHRLSYSRHAQSISRARGNRLSTSGASGIGFSMSGETELRMALAAAAGSGMGGGGARSAGAVEEGFRFSERELPPLSVQGGAVRYGGFGYEPMQGRTKGTGMGMEPGSRSSFMSRVKKLRKGLKEMLTTSASTTS